LFNILFKKPSEFALKLERILGFKPKHIAPYHQAFTHKSIIQKNNLQLFESNERLEFLGDAIIESIVSAYLFNKFPFKDEGFLTQLRSKIVSRQTLNNLSIKIGLQNLLHTDVERESKTLYGDALEALVGAIYLDKGFAYAQQFVIEKLIKNHLDIAEILATETNFKSRVLEWTQKNKKQLSYHISEKEEGNTKLFAAELFIDNELKGTGIAYAKKQAEQLAAEVFFKEIN